MRIAALLLAAGLAVAGALAGPPARPAYAARWGSSYGDPPAFCPAQSLLPGTYAVVVSNDPSVPDNPERSTFWGIHLYPGYDDWYGYWYGDFAGSPGGDSGWRFVSRVAYGSVGTWNFSDWGWAVHGHAKQYVAYFNWTFGGQCGFGWYGAGSPPPYMADVYGNPVVDIYVDSVPPEPPQPKVTAVTPTSVSFAWDPVEDRGDGAGADYWAVGMDHYTSWLTVDGGPAQQLADSADPRPLTATGLAPGQTACVHVRAFDKLANATGDQQACGRPVGSPPPPPPPPPPVIGLNPLPAGLTGLATWAWLSPAPATYTVAETVAGVQYTVTATPVAVSWNFGDSALSSLVRAPGGFGQAYPQASTVSHVYQTQLAAPGYAVVASVHWSVAWTAWSGTGWLGPYSEPGFDVVSGPTAYAVQQAQTEVTAVS